MTKLALPGGAKESIAPHLYYGRYPFKLALHRLPNHTVCGITPPTMNDYDYWYNNYTNELEKTKAFVVKFKPHLAKTKGTVRTRTEYRTMTYFFEERADLADFLKNTKADVASNFKVELFSMTEDQAAASKLDAKIQYRKSLYCDDQFTYRLELKKETDDDMLDALVAQFFSDEEQIQFNKRMALEFELAKGQAKNWGWVLNPNSWPRAGRIIKGTRGQMQFGDTWRSTILYLKEEDDAALAKLIMSGKTKITKAVVV